MHTLHGCFDLFHRLQDLSEPVVDYRAGPALLNGVDNFDSSADQAARVLDHVHMGQDESCL